MQIIKPKHQKLYMDLVDRISQESYATRLKVGCIIVKDDNIVSMGWNGTPPDWSNECENDNVTKPEVYHAEENAILKLAKMGGNALGSTAFITHTPCMNCARMLARSGIVHVVYKHKYRDDSGVKFLEKFGIKVEQFLDQDVVPAVEITNNLNTGYVPSNFIMAHLLNK